MKLLTLNCHSWQEENQMHKIKYLAEVINNKDYDVVALQEVSQLIESEVIEYPLKKDNFAILLKQELDNYNKDKYSFYWDFSHIGFDKYEEGLAIFTKHKVIDNESFLITNSSDKNYWKTRKIVKSKISYKDKILNFYSCHLGWWNDVEEPFDYQVDNLLKKSEPNEYSFFMGDFNNNAFVRNEGYDYLISKGLKDLFVLANERDSGITVKGKIDGWDENKEKLRLDLVLSNNNIEVKTSKVIFNGKNKDIISDHFGVETIINI